MKRKDIDAHHLSFCLNRIRIFCQMPFVLGDQSDPAVCRPEALACAGCVLVFNLFASKIVWNIQQFLINLIFVDFAYILIILQWFLLNDLIVF